MIRKALTFTDDGEGLATVTFTMTLTEAAAIHAVFGCLNGRAHRRLGMADEDDVYGPLCGVLNMFYEDGSPVRSPSLATLNDPLEGP